MRDADLAAFFAVPRLSVLGTVRADGSPHLVPVKCMRDDTRFLVLTRRETAKVRLAANPRASLSEHTSTIWVTVEGPAWVTDDVAELEVARAAYARRFGKPDTWANCVLAIQVDRILHGT